jgi:MFS family permease
MTIIAYSHGFLPAAFERTYGWPAERYAFYNGIANLIIGPLTVYAMGYLSDRRAAAGHPDAPLRIMFWSAAIMIPTSAIGMLMPTPWAALIVLWLGTAGIAGVTAVNINALLGITPGPIRAQVIALFYMAISLSGLLLGPTTVGMLSTRVFGEANIRYAMAVLPLLYGLIPLLIIPITRRLYHAQRERLDSTFR